MSNFDVLYAIYEKYNRLDVDLVIDAARVESHPFHGEFEWNDKIAGVEYRRLQAARLIRACKLTYLVDDQPKQVRAFLSVPPQPDRRERQSYVPTDEVVCDPFMMQMVLSQFERDLIAIKAKYSHLKEYASLVAKHLAA